MDDCSALAAHHQEPHRLPQQKASPRSRSLSRLSRSFQFFKDPISQVVQEENTQALSGVLRVLIGCSHVASGVTRKPGGNHRLLCAAALRPLPGAGFAALLSVELVTANAVLGNQVAPAELVRALLLCKDSEMMQLNLRLHAEFPIQN